MKIKTNKRAIIVLQLFLLILAGLVATRGAGELDPSYNASVAGGLMGSVHVFKVQPDGKILVGGSFQDINGYAASGLGRLNSDLTVDTSFNAPDFGGGVGLGGVVLALGLQSDGKIIVGGNIIGVNGVQNRGLKRLFPDGQLDTSFQAPTSDTTYYDLEVLPNDQILAGGVRFNANGTLDNSFTQINLTIKEYQVLADGKILAASLEPNALLRRYHSDGTFDSTFPSVVTDGSIEEIAVLPDGKILIGGNYWRVNGFVQGRISRLNANGTLDLTFNQNMTGFDGGGVFRIVPLPDGRLKVGGNITAYNGVPRRRAAILNADGSLDPSLQGTDPASATFLFAFEFLPDGKMLAGFSSNTALLTLFGFNADGTSAGIPRLVVGSISGIADMALQPDGKLVVAGSFQYSGNSSRRAIARFNTDGSLDTSFVPYFTNYYSITAVAVQPDGKILVGGGFGLALDRLNADGSRDTGFIRPFPTDSNNIIRDIASLPDGRFLVAHTFGGGMRMFNANGSNAAFSMPTPNGEIRKIVVQADGKYVIGGSFTSLGGNLRVGFARLNADGTVDTSFNPIGGANGTVNDVEVQADGKVVIGGDFTGVNGSLTQQGVGRLNADGALDTTFVQNQQMNSPVLDVQIQPDGKILAVGGFTLIGTTGRVAIARFNANGSVDSGFIPPQLNIPGVTNILLQTDGKILIGGPFTKVNGQSHVRLARLLNAATPTRTPFDYDGDGRADISVFRPSENKWYILQSSTASLRENVFGLAGDVPVPSDYDGDGKSDVAIFRPSSGAWWYLSSINGQQVNVNFGAAGDIPRPSDFDGDGKTDFVLYRPSNSVWYRMSSTGVVAAPFAFGIAEDKPLIGDFDGDGKSDPAIFRPSSGDWWYAPSSSPNGQFAVVHWGALGDIPTPADVDADGKTDFMVYRPSNGGWYILRSGEQNYTILQFGLQEDKPVVADYDGDGKADVAVFRPSTGTWYLLQTTSGFGAVQWGNASDIPTENSFLQ